jgi:hypothetical protein
VDAPPTAARVGNGIGLDLATPQRVLARLVEVAPGVVDGAGGVAVVGHLLEHLLDPLRAGAVHAESADHRAHVAIQ